MGHRRGRDASASAASPLSEARKLKQQAERKPVGVTKEQLFVRSSELFESALQPHQLPQQDHNEALFDLAETYYLCANAIKTFASQNSLTPFNGRIKKAAVSESKLQALFRSTEFFRRSFETYSKITLEELREETIVNSGNALCDWADILLELPESHGGGVKPAAKLYMDAHQRYSAALELSREDLEILSNLGDCCIKRAELLIQSQAPSEETSRSAASLYDQALEAYNFACSVADSRKGDDLCGLLQNWSAGLVSKAQHVLDNAEALKLLECAREKLRTASTLNPSNGTLFNALGELSITESEKFTDQLQDSEKGYQCMLTAIECFGAALKIDSGNMDSLVSIAETHHLAAKVMRSAGFHQRSHEHEVQSSGFYKRAAELLKADEECRYDLDFSQQCDLLFNFACAAAQCGLESDAAMALKLLVQVEAVSSSDLLNDPDLETFKSKDWFHTLVARIG